MCKQLKPGPFSSSSLGLETRLVITRIECADQLWSKFVIERVQITTTVKFVGCGNVYYR